MASRSKLKPWAVKKALFANAQCVRSVRTSAASIGRVPVVATDVAGRNRRRPTLKSSTSSATSSQALSESDENHTFRATPSPGLRRYSYDWDFGDGNSSDKRLPPVFDGLSDYTVTLDATSWVGCTNQAYTVVLVRSCYTAAAHRTTTASTMPSKWWSEIMNYESGS